MQANTAMCVGVPFCSCMCACIQLFMCTSVCEMSRLMYYKFILFFSLFLCRTLMLKLFNMYTCVYSFYVIIACIPLLNHKF